jgi:uncharacterized protein (TIGR02246 family)
MAVATVNVEWRASMLRIGQEYPQSLDGPPAATYPLPIWGSATGARHAPTNSERREEAMTRAAILAALNAQTRAWEAGDLDALLADFAPDAVLLAPATYLSGTDAIRTSFASYLATHSVRRIDLTRVVIDGDAGALEWTWHEIRHTDSQQNTVDDAIIFTFHAGKITHWREYFDTTTHA